MRSQLLTIGEYEIVLDAYNANPSSMRAALTSFKRMTEESTTEGTPLCILGDMAELGAHTTAAHEEILAFAHELGLPTWTVGPCFNEAAQAFENVLAFGNTKEAAAHCEATALTNHRILLKGSRSIALEALVEVL